MKNIDRMAMAVERTTGGVIIVDAEEVARAALLAIEPDAAMVVALEKGHKEYLLNKGRRRDGALRAGLRAVFRQIAEE